MAYDFGTMQLEMLERLGGDMDRFNTVRIRRWINDAMHALNSEERWDYMFVSTTGAAPLTIADLDKVETVTDVANLNPLVQIDREALVTDVADLTVAGTPEFWYKTAPTTIAVFPVSTVTLTVKYIKFAADLAAAADTPLVPDRWRSAIVERALTRAYRDIGNWDAFRASMDEYNGAVQQMRTSMLTQPARQARTSWSEDD